MRANHWEIFKKCARAGETEKIPAGLIIDSPWLPGYAGITTLDYFTMPDKWLDANIKVRNEFPDILFIPDFWVEYGMTAEPSGFGCRINFFKNNTPTVSHIVSSFEDMDIILAMETPNPRKDGLMPLILNLYGNMRERVADMGESIKVVAARGPLTIASHLMGLTEFLTALKLEPDKVHRLLKMTSRLAEDWLMAQREALQETEAVMLLDDVVGFLGKSDYLEFVHPYFKSIFSSFKDCIRIYHNDTDNPVCYGYLEDMGVNIFNFTHKQSISRVRELVGKNVCLMGNVPPLEVMTQGTEEDVYKSTLECLRTYKDKKGIILSAGGGVSPKTPSGNIHSMLKALNDYNNSNSEGNILSRGEGSNG